MLSLSRLTLTLTSLVFLIASASAAWPEDSPATPPSAPTTDDLVAAIMFGTPEDVARAAGWMRALSQERVEDVLMRLRRATQTSAVTQALGRVTGTVSGSTGGDGQRVELRRTRLDAAAAFRGLLSGSRPLESPVDTGGKYSISAVPPGQYEVVLVRGTTALAFADVVISRDEVVSANLALDRTAVEVNVAGGAGGGSEHPRVVLIGVSPGSSVGRFIAEPRIGEQVVVSGLSSGLWEWTGNLDLVTSNTVRHELLRDQRGAVELEFPEYGWIEVRLKGPVVAATETVVIASSDGARNLIRQSTRDGRCRVAAPPGSWTVRRGSHGASVAVVVRSASSVQVDL